MIVTNATVKDISFRIEIAGILLAKIATISVDAKKYAILAVTPVGNEDFHESPKIESHSTRPNDANNIGHRYSSPTLPKMARFPTRRIAKIVSDWIVCFGPRSALRIRPTQTRWPSEDAAALASEIAARITSTLGKRAGAS